VRWSRPADGRAIAAAAALFVGAWLLLHVGFWRHDQIVDTPVYQHYGDLMAQGKVPYRDFTPEYPPLALPVFALPSLVTDGFDHFSTAFQVELAVLGVGLVVAVGLAGASVLALELFALFPLVLGTVVLTRFDLWPALLTAVALAALVRGRDRLGAGVLGAATAAKLYPAVLLPLALVWTWKRRGRREARIALAAFVAVVLVVYVPFLVLGAHGVLESLSRQLSRPLQIESLGAGILLALHQAFGLHLEWSSGSGSQNLVGTLPDALAWGQTVLQAVAFVAIWIRFARGPATRERLVRHAAAAVVAFVALGKVLSPQFMIWLVPLVALVGGAPLALLGGALVLTQLWFPFRYWSLVKEFDPLASWLVAGRDLVLVALLVALLRSPSSHFRHRSLATGLGGSRHGSSGHEAVEHSGSRSAVERS
jgi:hypothetical protein